MSAILSRSNIMLIAMFITALLGGLLFISTASAQDAPVGPPTANGGIMMGAAAYPLHAGRWMSDTVTAVPGRHMDTHGDMASYPAGSAMRGSHTGTTSGYMMGSMTSRHIHNSAPSRQPPGCG